MGDLRVEHREYAWSAYGVNRALNFLKNPGRAQAVCGSVHSSASLPKAGRPPAHLHPLPGAYAEWGHNVYSLEPGSTLQFQVHRLGNSRRPLRGPERGVPVRPRRRSLSAQQHIPLLPGRRHRRPLRLVLADPHLRQRPGRELRTPTISPQIYLPQPSLGPNYRQVAPKSLRRVPIITRHRPNHRLPHPSMYRHPVVEGLRVESCRSKAHNRPSPLHTLRWTYRTVTQRSLFSYLHTLERRSTKRKAGLTRSYVREYIYPQGDGGGGVDGAPWLTLDGGAGRTTWSTWGDHLLRQLSRAGRPGAAGRAGRAGAGDVGATQRGVHPDQVPLPSPLFPVTSTVTLARDGPARALCSHLRARTMGLHSWTREGGTRAALRGSPAGLYLGLPGSGPGSEVPGRNQNAKKAPLVSRGSPFCLAV